MGEVHINVGRTDVRDIQLDGLQLDVSDGSKPSNPLEEHDLGHCEDGPIHIVELGVEEHEIEEGSGLLHM